MFFAVISIFPEMFAAVQQYGIVGRAIDEKKATLALINPRDFAQDTYRRVDERPFGGGPGMVMMPEPLAKAIQYAKMLVQESGCLHCPVVYLSPQGTCLTESVVQSYQDYDGMILLCGRYEGIDERIIAQYVDIELSIGDYVLTGGELPAMVLMDSIIRRLPAVMNDDRSAEQDSFVDGLLDCPHFTRPVHFDGQEVPNILISGHHKNIAKWRFFEQLKRTQTRRPDMYHQFLMKSEGLNAIKSKWLEEYLQKNK